MDYYIYSDELYHSGRLGMKWYQHIFGKVRDAVGERRATHKEIKAINKSAKRQAKQIRKEAARNKKIKKAQDKADELLNSTMKKYNPPKKEKKKSWKDMTLEEKQKAKADKQLEKDYKDLVKQTTPESKKYLNNILKQIGEKSLVNMGTQAANSGLTALMNKTLDSAINSRSKLSDDEKARLKQELRFYTNNKKKDK